MCKKRRTFKTGDSLTKAEELAMEKSMADLKAGRFKTYKSSKEFFAELENQGIY